MRTKNAKKEKIASRRGYQTRSKKIFTNFNSKTKEEKIKKIEKKALNENEIKDLLKGQKNFLGVFASDELESLRILKFPVRLRKNYHLVIMAIFSYFCVTQTGVNSSIIFYRPELEFSSIGVSFLYYELGHYF